jgi:hypothetical protein
MKYKFFTKTDRAKSIVAELKNKCEIIKQNDEWITVEITIENDLDALNLFHAGIKAGMDEILNQIKL